MRRVVKLSEAKGNKYLPIKSEKYKVGKSWSNTTQEGTSRMKRLLANKKKVS
jgi:hypothetical protein